MTHKEQRIIFCYQDGRVVYKDEEAMKFLMSSYRSHLQHMKISSHIGLCEEDGVVQSKIQQDIKE